MAPPSDSTAFVSENIPQSPNTVEPYLRNVLSSSNATGNPVSLFDPASSAENHAAQPDLFATWPTLSHNGRNQILLFPGSFNPPHQGHLATIRYFFERRDQLCIVALFIFADPDEMIRTKKKEWGEIILPQELRNNMFYQVPELSQLIVDRWLHLLVGGSHSGSPFHD
jgi:hypothetical protein